MMRLLLLLVSIAAVFAVRPSFLGSSAPVPALLPPSSSCPSHSTLPLASLRGGGSVPSLPTLSSLDAAVASATLSGKGVVVDFGASWCGPCRAISPVFDALSEEFKGTVVFLKVDVDANVEAAAKYDITAMPTFVFINRKGEIVDRLAGANVPRLREMLKSL